jgi:hypothetical protein
VKGDLIDGKPLIRSPLVNITFVKRDLINGTTFMSFARRSLLISPDKQRSIGKSPRILTVLEGFTMSATITLTFQSADLSDERLQERVEDLLPQLRAVDGVDEVGLVSVGEAPENSKAIGALALGALKFTVENSKILTGLVGLGSAIVGQGKTVEVTVKTAKGQEIIGKAKNLAELEQVLQLGEATIKRLEQE